MAGLGHPGFAIKVDQLEAENVALRHQVIVPPRQVPGRGRLTNLDRLFLVQLYGWFPSILKVLPIMQPEKCHSLASGPISSLLALEVALAGRAAAIVADLRENPLWGAPKSKPAA